MKLKVFQVITLLHPKDEKDDSETKVLGDGLKTILAADEKQAAVLAARAIPEEEIKNLARIELVVRPF